MSTLCELFMVLNYLEKDARHIHPSNMYTEKGQCKYTEDIESWWDTNYKKTRI